MKATTRLNVLLVGDFLPDIGGVSMYVHNLLTSLTSQNINVSVFHTKKGKDVYDGKTQIYRIPSSILKRMYLLLTGLIYIPLVIKIIPFMIFHLYDFLYVLLLTGRMHEISKRFTPYVIHSNHLSLRSLSSILIGKRNKIPVIVTSHGYDSELPPNMYEFILRKAVIANSNKIIVLTEAKRHFLTKIYGDLLNFFVIPNFVSCSKVLKATSVDDLNKIKTQAKNELSLSFSNKILITFIGRVTKEKGIFDLLDAIKIIRKENIELYNKIRVFFAGKGPDIDKLKDAITKIGLDNVTVLGPIHEKRKENLLRASDIIVLPTYWPETFPTIILEAYKYGAPVISYYFRGLQELVIDGVTGFIIRTPNSKKLSSIIMHFSTKPYIIRKLGFNTLKFVNNFCAENVINKIIRLYFQELKRCRK